MIDAQRFRILATLSVADGRVTPEEAALLSRWAGYFGLATADAREIVASVKRSPVLEITTPDDLGDSLALFLELLLLARRDGRISDEEASLLRVMGEACRVPADFLAECLPRSAPLRSAVRWGSARAEGPGVWEVTVFPDRFRFEGPGGAAQEFAHEAITEVRWATEGFGESLTLRMADGREFTLGTSRGEGPLRPGRRGLMRAVHEFLLPRSSTIRFLRRERFGVAATMLPSALFGWLLSMPGVLIFSNRHAQGWERWPEATMLAFPVVGVVLALTVRALRRFVPYAPGDCLRIPVPRPAPGQGASGSAGARIPDLLDAVDRAAADGRLAPAERAGLERLASACGISDALFRSLLRAAFPQDHRSPLLSSTPHTSRIPWDPRGRCVPLSIDDDRLVIRKEGAADEIVPLSKVRSVFQFAQWAVRPMRGPVSVGTPGSVHWCRVGYDGGSVRFGNTKRENTDEARARLESHFRFLRLLHARLLPFRDRITFLEGDPRLAWLGPVAAALVWTGLAWATWASGAVDWRSGPDVLATAIFGTVITAAFALLCRAARARPYAPDTMV